MLKNQVYACLLAVLLLAGALPASTAAAGELPAGPPAYEENTITGVSPLGTTINLFDYWLTDQTAPDSTNPDRFEEKGINAVHALLFGNGMGSSSSRNYGDWNQWTGSKSPRTGIVASRLGSDGYPVLNLTISGTALDGRDGGESLAYLFDPSIVHEGKAAYEDVQGMLRIDQSGYYSYNSQENYAVFYPDQNSFLLYDQPGVMSGGAAGTHGQFFPFNQVQDGSYNGNLYNSSIYSTNATINHYFGIHMSTRFVQQNGGYIDEAHTTPIQYEFSGDDDVWVFIDGVLVADLGGIHDLASLSIDFSTGKIAINGQEQAETLGGLLGYATPVFPDDTYHTLDFFYLERGNVDSNMSLKYNLVYVPESSIYKIDQNGDPLPGLDFELCKAVLQDDGRYTAGEVVATGTTDADGRIILLDDKDDLLTIQMLIEKLKITLPNENTVLILREPDSPDGYRSCGDLELYFYQSKPDSPPFLLSKNHWQTGAYAMARLTVTTNETITYDNKSTAFDPENNLMFAVVFKKVGNEWRPISGSPATGWNIEADGSWESIRKANLYPFMLSSSGSYTAMIDELPGDVKKYVEAGGSEDNYRIGYYFSNQNDLEAIGGNNTFEITSPMNRMAAVNLYVPNIRNDLTVQKLDQNGNLITDGAATFELRPANSDGTYNASASPEQTQVTSMGEATFTAISNGIYYLVETAAPAGYIANTTPAKVIVNDTGIYADAGRANDGISVELSVGRLVNSMAQFSSKDTVDTTLNQIVAKFYTTQSGIYEGFQWRTINGTGKDAAFTPVAGVTYHPAYSVTGDSLETAKWHLYGTVQDGTPVGMHLAHLANHPEGVSDGLYETSVMLADGGSGITAQETDTGWSALLVEQCMLHSRDSGTPYTNLTDDNLIDLTALFTGDVTVKVKNDPIVGHLAVQKTVDGNAGDTNKDWHFTIELKNAGMPLSGTFVYTGTSVPGVPAPESGVLTLDGDGKTTIQLRHGQTITIRDIAPGVSYTVTEVEGNADGYVTTLQNAEGLIPENGTATAAFINTKNAFGGLIVTKTVEGDAGDTGRDWHFTVTLDDSGISGLYGGMFFTNGVAAFTLRHGGEIAATGLPAGISYTVTESEANQAGYLTTVTGDRGQIPAEGTARAAFINTKSVPRGNLTVSKTVSGRNPAPSTPFGFTVTLDDRMVNGRYGGMTFHSGVAEFTLRHGESVTASGLPAGVGYLVQEDADEAYAVSSEGAEGTIIQDSTAEASFVNRRVVLPPKTGDNSPIALWFALMAFSLCCAALLAGLRKRDGRTGR